MQQWCLKTRILSIQWLKRPCRVTSVEARARGCWARGVLISLFLRYRPNKHICLSCSMKKLLLASLFAIAATVMTSENSSAQQPTGYGVLPYGFYQPYGARYGTTIRTPPYFATNPPVYYGSRHARPYGISPFASLPQVAPGADYRSRLRMQFEQPLVPTPQPACNPCVHHSTTAPALAKKGPVRMNPFVDETDKIAKN